MKKILVTTDFSEQAAAAFTAAKEQATLLGNTDEVEIILLSVVHRPVGVYGGEVGLSSIDLEKIFKEIEKDAQDKIDAIAQDTFGGFKVTAKVEHSRRAAHSKILEFAKEQSIDLLIMATHGKSGFERFFLGSVTEKTIRNAPCPILIIPSQK